MVDEIAWGVGWGAEGDDATHGESDDDLELQCGRASASQSRSRSRPAELSIPDISDWQHEEPRSRPALDAASRRSSSRAKRSQSRAPIVTSSARASNRSMSRHSRAPSPSHISISTSILNLSSTTSSPFFASRSPSPSIVPTTPADIESLFHPPTVLEQPDELDLDSPRDNGRSLRSIRHGDLYSAVHQREDTRDVPSDWSAELGKKPIPEDQVSLSSNGHDELNHHARRSARSSRNSSLAPSRRKRPASAQPPSSTKSWARDQERVIAAPLVQKHSVESFLKHFRGLPASGRVNRGRSMDRE